MSFSLILGPKSQDHIRPVHNLQHRIRSTIISEYSKRLEEEDNGKWNVGLKGNSKHKPSNNWHTSDTEFWPYWKWEALFCKLHNMCPNHVSYIHKVPGRCISVYVHCWSIQVFKPCILQNISFCASILFQSLHVLSLSMACFSVYCLVHCLHHDIIRIDTKRKQPK